MNKQKRNETKKWMTTGDKEHTTKHKENVLTNRKKDMMDAKKHYNI